MFPFYKIILLFVVYNILKFVQPGLFTNYKEFYDLYVSIINAGLRADADEFQINAMKDRAYILNRNLRSVMHVSFFFFQSIVTNLLFIFSSCYRHFHIFNIGFGWEGSCIQSPYCEDRQNRQRSPA